LRDNFKLSSVVLDITLSESTFDLLPVQKLDASTLKGTSLYLIYP